MKRRPPCPERGPIGLDPPMDAVAGGSGGGGKGASAPGLEGEDFLQETKPHLCPHDANKVCLAGLLHVSEAFALPCPPGVWIAFGSVTEDLRATGHQVGWLSRRSGQDRLARPSLGEGNRNHFANCSALFPGPKPRGSPQPLRKGSPLPTGSKPHFCGLEEPCLILCRQKVLVQPFRVLYGSPAKADSTNLSLKPGFAFSFGRI